MTMTPEDEQFGLGLPWAARKKFNKIKATDWKEEDWKDLLIAQNWLIARIAARHGIANPNDGNQGQMPQADYAYATIEEYEEIIGYRVTEAFRNGWMMARLTLAQLRSAGMSG